MGRILWVELGGYGQTLFSTVLKGHLPPHWVAELQQHSNSMKQHHQSSEPAIFPPPAVGKTGQEVHFHVGKTCGDHATIGGHIRLIDATPRILYLKADLWRSLLIDHLNSLLSQKSAWLRELELEPGHEGKPIVERGHLLSCVSIV